MEGVGDGGSGWGGGGEGGGEGGSYYFRHVHITAPGFYTLHCNKNDTVL